MVKKIGLVSSFICASSLSLLVNYFHNIDTNMSPTTFHPIKFGQVTSKIRLPILTNNLDTEEFNDTLQLSTDQYNSQQVVLKINQQAFITKLVSFVKNLILSEIKKQDLDGEELNGNLSYKFKTKNTILVIVNWNLKNKDIKYFDYFSISLDY